MNADAHGQTTNLNSRDEGGGPEAVRRQQEKAPYRRVCATGNGVEHTRSEVIPGAGIEAIASPLLAHRCATERATAIETP